VCLGHMEHAGKCKGVTKICQGWLKDMSGIWGEGNRSRVSQMKSWVEQDRDDRCLNQDI
jgi:hypothetical protein